jgi:hypothetical protein
MAIKARMTSMIKNMHIRATLAQMLLIEALIQTAEAGKGALKRCILLGSGKASTPPNSQTKI